MVTALDELDRPDGDPEVVRQPEAARADDATPMSSQRWPTLTAVFLLVSVGRYLFGVDRNVFHISPDEPANLAMARWMSGGTSWNMFGFSTWRPGFAVLLAPFSRLVDDPETLLRVALGLNSVLGGVGALLLVRLLMTTVDVSLRPAAITACVVALAPTSLATSAYVWAEPLVTVAFLTTLIAIVEFYRRPAGGWALLGIGAAVAGMTTHGRLMPLVPVAAALIVGRAVRTDRRLAIGASIYTVALVAASVWFTDLVIEQVWERPSGTNTVRAVLGRSDDVGGLLASLLGQTWYQLIVTLGVVGVGIVVVVLAAADRLPDALNRVDARVILATTLPLVALSILFMAGRDRVDHHIYGRYNDATLWPILAIGLVAVFSPDVIWTRRAAMRVHAAVIALGVVLGLTVDRLLGDKLQGPMVTDMMPGIVPFGIGGGGVDALAVTAMATALAVVLLLVVQLPMSTPIRTLLFLSLLLMLDVRLFSGLGEKTNSWQLGEAVEEVEASILPPGEPVGFRFEFESPHVAFTVQRLFSQLYQWHLGDNEFVDASSDHLPDDVYFVFAPEESATLEDHGFEVVWNDPNVGMSLWALDEAASGVRG